MERPAFCPPRHLVELGFNQIMADVICPESVRVSLLEKIDAWIIAGNDFRSACIAAKNLFSGIEWTWAWHQFWEARFKAQAILPYLWQDKISKPALLWHSIEHRIHMLVRAEDGRQSQIDAPGRWELIYAYAGCEVEQQIAEENGAASFERLPPFFPGDRTRIRLKRLPRSM